MSRVKDTSDIERHLPPEVTVVFRKITSDGDITIERSESVGILEELGATPLERAVQYYKIDTTIVSEGIIKIRSIARVPKHLTIERMPEEETQGQIFEWRDGEWWDRTLYCVNAGNYKLLVGVTDHLSGFGIRF